MFHFYEMTPNSHISQKHIYVCVCGYIYIYVYVYVYICIHTYEYDTLRKILVFHETNMS